MFRLVRRAALALGVGVALTLAGAGTAHASATGHSTWGWFTIPGSGGEISIPSGTLEHTVTGWGQGAGQGVFVEKEGFYFAAAGNICNYQVQFQYFRTDGSHHRTISTPVYTTCSSLHENQNIPVGSVMPPGLTCAVLYSNGHEVTRQCHSLTEY